jgi:hypothetical protein
MTEVRAHEEQLISEGIPHLRRLIVHVGPAKTGTSAIQHALVSAEEGLFCYPKVGLWPDGSHHNLVFSVFPQDRRPEAKVLPFEDAMHELRAEAMRSDKDVLVSSEALNASTVSRFADEVAGALADLIGVVVLVIVVREHLERAASVYNQRVKDWFYCERSAPDDFLAEHAAGLVYRPLATALKATGLKVVAVNYHGDGDLAARFVVALGGDPAELPPAARRNVSIGMKGLVSLLEVNRLHGAQDRDRYFAALRRIRGFFSGGAFPFSAAGAERVRSIFDTDAAFLAGALGVELPRRSLDLCQGRLVITTNEFTEIERALSAAQITDTALLAAIERYVCREEGGAVTAPRLRGLTAG